LNYACDPEWKEKMIVQRVPIRRIILFFILGSWWLKRRVQKVEDFDHQKRKEQRAMQNNEIEDISGKYAAYVLFD